MVGCVGGGGVIRGVSVTGTRTPSTGSCVRWMSTAVSVTAATVRAAVRMLTQGGHEFVIGLGRMRGTAAAAAAVGGGRVRAQQRNDRYRIETHIPKCGVTMRSGQLWCTSGRVFHCSTTTTTTTTTVTTIFMVMILDTTFHRHLSYIYMFVGVFVGIYVCMTNTCGMWTMSVSVAPPLRWDLGSYWTRTLR